MYEYNLWGADVISDVELNLEDKDTRFKFLNAKAEIDKHGVLTILFLVFNNKIRAYPMSTVFSNSTKEFYYETNV